MLTNAHVWREAQERLRPQMTRAQFDTWLRGTRLASLDQGSAVLAVRTTFAKELLESQYRERIESALASVTGRPCSLRVVVAPTRSAGGPAEAEEEATVRARVANRPLGPTHHRPGERQDDHAAYARPSLFESGADAASDAPPSGGDSLSEAATSVDGSARSLTSPDETGRPSDLHERPRATQHVPSQGQIHDTASRERGSGPPRADRANEAAPLGHAGQAGVRSRPPQASAPRDANGVRRQPGSGEGSARMHTSGSDRSARDGFDDGDRDRDDYDMPPQDAGRAANRYTPNTPYTPPTSGASGSHAGHISHAGVPAPRLNTRYTFKTFIVGSSNQLAYAASVAVGEAPGQAYNPLFLYGGVGLGKTHLLHAVGHAAEAQGFAVLYVTSETFTNEIVNAIRYRTTEEFRAKYRTADVLLVDDIQFIAGKDSTEEEFFHTFNSLYESGRQIVICSDHPPKAIVSLEERLRSRFEWGMIADVQPPDFGTRVAILRAKADIMQRQVPDDVIDYLADRIQSNIRELEGSLNRLLAFSTLQRQPLTVDIAKAALATLASDARARRISIAEVLAAVSEFYHISADDLRGKQRDKHIVVPRQVAMYLMRQETEASLVEIGQSLGGRDHSTVLHGCEKIGREQNENTALRKEIVAIRQRLLG